MYSCYYISARTLSKLKKHNSIGYLKDGASYVREALIPLGGPLQVPGLFPRPSGVIDGEVLGGRCGNLQVGPDNTHR